MRHLDAAGSLIEKAVATGMLLPKPNGHQLLDKELAATAGTKAGEDCFWRCG